jgi:hypothetical protein
MKKSMTETDKNNPKFGIWAFGNWDLFGFWCLVFGASTPFSAIPVAGEIRL